jgi:hypothetical protein
MNRGVRRSEFPPLVFLSDVLCDPLWFNDLNFTTKGPERKVIAQWAIIANGPDCREGGYHKVAQRIFSTALVSSNGPNVVVKMTFETTSFFS